MVEKKLRHLLFFDFLHERPLMGNPNLVSGGGKYALDFLTKKALLSQDIDFQQSLIEQKDLKQGHLNDASKNFIIDLIKTKLQ